jgi:hypothetical protein
MAHEKKAPPKSAQEMLDDLQLSYNELQQRYDENTQVLANRVADEKNAHAKTRETVDELKTELITMTQLFNRAQGYIDRVLDMERTTIRNQHLGHLEGPAREMETPQGFRPDAVSTVTVSRQGRDSYRNYSGSDNERQKAWWLR